MTAEMIAGFAGVLLSLIFNYVPGLNTKFAGLAKETQQLVMLGLMVLVSAAALGLACANLAVDFGIAVECTQAGVISLLQALFFAVVGNQGAYKILPQTKQVKKVRALR